MEDLINKLLSRAIIDDNGCWTWTGSKTHNGYGSVKYRGKWWRVHRLYLMASGVDLIDGMVVDHLCNNRLCFNPDHLEQVTNKTNLHRGLAHNANKTHCAQGHEYNELNTHIRKSGKRECKECNKIRAQKNRDKAKMSEGSAIV